MNKNSFVFVAVLISASLLIGCGDTNRGVSEKPVTFAPVPKGGPSTVGAGGGGQVAPPIQAPRK